MLLIANGYTKTFLVISQFMFITPQRNVFRITAANAIIGVKPESCFSRYIIPLTSRYYISFLCIQFGLLLRIMKYENTNK